MDISSKQHKLETCLDVSSFLLNVMVSANHNYVRMSFQPKFRSIFVTGSRRKWERDEIRRNGFNTLFRLFHFAMTVEEDFVG